MSEWNGVSAGAPFDSGKIKRGELCFLGVPEGSWPKLTKIITSMFKEEVKTPLSFYFRVAILVPLILGAILLVSESANFKLEVLGMTFLFLLILCAVVAAFAWCKPKHLVYGELGHRAELKLEYGTSQNILTHKQATTIEGVAAPPLRLDSGGEMSK